VLTDKSAMMETTSEFDGKWTRFDNIDFGYYGCEVLFDDILKPLVAAEDVAGKVVADIGSGTGRIVRMLASAGAAQIFAIEPSEAISVLRRNVAGIRQIECLHVDGASIPCEPALDWVFSIGVIHHVPDAKQVMITCLRALKPRGRVAIWLYGREGNELYLVFVLPVRRVLRCCRDLLLTALSWFAVPMLGPSGFLWVLAQRAGQLRPGARGIATPGSTWRFDDLDQVNLCKMSGFLPSSEPAIGRSQELATDGWCGRTAELPLLVELERAVCQQKCGKDLEAIRLDRVLARLASPIRIGTRQDSSALVV